MQANPRYNATFRRFKCWRKAMNKATRDIMQLLNIDAETAEKVQLGMEQDGLDFSECTRGEFNAVARKAYQELSSHDEADFEQVAESLRQSGIEAEVMATGGGIDC